MGKKDDESWLPKKGTKHISDEDWRGYHPKKDYPFEDISSEEASRIVQEELKGIWR